MSLRVLLMENKPRSKKTTRMIIDWLRKCHLIMTFNNKSNLILRTILMGITCCKEEFTKKPSRIISDKQNLTTEGMEISPIKKIAMPSRQNKLEQITHPIILRDPEMCLVLEELSRELEERIEDKETAQFKETTKQSHAAEWMTPKFQDFTTEEYVAYIERKR
jgi:hypothetical protein